MKISVILPTNKKNSKEELDKMHKVADIVGDGIVFNPDFSANVRDYIQNCKYILEPTLISLVNQSFNDFEVLLCHKYPDDVKEDFEWLCNHLELDGKLIKEKYSIWHELGDEYRTVNNIRNTGILEAKGELLLFLDDYTIFNNNLLQQAWDAYQDGYYITARGMRRIRYEPDARPVETPTRKSIVDKGIYSSYNFNNVNEGDIIPNSATWTYCCTVSLEETLRVNGFDECLHPDTPIYSNGVTRISDIKENDLVLSHDGIYHNVDKIMKRNYNGNILKIVPSMFNIPIYVTPNHPILSVIPNKSGKITRKPTVYKLDTVKKHYIDNRKWKNASELNEGDYLLFPTLKEENDVESLLISDFVDCIIMDDYVYAPTIIRGNRMRASRSKPIKNEIKINSDFLRLCGYYLSEGCYTDNGSSVNLTFSFNLTEKKLVDDVVNLVDNIFKTDCKIEIKEETHTMNVHVFSSTVARLFNKLFGHYALNKNIPKWIMDLPKEKLKGLIYGMWAGDGYSSHKEKNRDKFSYATISPNLAFSFMCVLTKFEIIPFFSERETQGFGKENSFEFHINGYNAKLFSNIVGMKLKDRKKWKRYGFIFDGYIHIPIRKIESEHYEGNVYNLEVKDSHSYVSTFILHNCWDGNFGGTDQDFGIRLARVSKYKRKLMGTIYEFKHTSPRQKLRDDGILRQICGQWLPKHVRANEWKPTEAEMRRYKRWHESNIGYLNPLWNRFLDVPMYDLRELRNKSEIYT